jgi:lipopolysaccharide heptosyltransferase II
MRDRVSYSELTKMPKKWQKVKGLSGESESSSPGLFDPALFVPLLIGLFAPARFSAYHTAMDSPSKTLIIRFSSIGDIVLSSALIRSLRARFPKSQIDFVTRTEYADLVRHNAHLNATVTYDRSSGLAGLYRLAARLREERYDLVVDIHYSLRSRFLRAMIHAPQSVTIDKRLRERHALVKHKVNRYQAVVSVADRYIEPLAPFGVCKDDKGLELHIPDEVRIRTSDKMAALQLDRYECVIGFCPAARHITKRWPPERFIDLGIRLAKERKAKILLFGGPEDNALCSSIASEVNARTGGGSVEDLSGRLDLLETGAAMQSCDALVTNDTGLMHIAAAKQRKLVAVFGSTVREFGFFPYGTQSIVIERLDVPCRPCSHIGRAVCPEGHFRCMKDIQVEEVERAIAQLLLSPEQK